MKLPVIRGCLLRCCWVKLKVVKSKNGVAFYVVHVSNNYFEFKKSVRPYFFFIVLLGSCPWSEVFLLLKSRFSSSNN